tara:strand:- start:772 stop:1377 length:606 start_codon:yes stop_codon:yes gene_type:complete
MKSFAMADNLNKFETLVINVTTGQHYAHRVAFDDLYSVFQDYIEKNLIFSATSNDLEIFNYTRNTVYNQLWDQYTLIARGLILCPSQKKIVATSFPKFFNYGEVTSYIPPAKSFAVTDKMDGSLGIVFWHNKWMVTTKGSFESEQSQWALGIDLESHVKDPIGRMFVFMARKGKFFDDVIKPSKIRNKVFNLFRNINVTSR